MPKSISPRRYAANLYVRQIFTRGAIFCDLLGSVLFLVALITQARSSLWVLLATLTGLSFYFALKDLRVAVVKAEFLDTLAAGDRNKRARFAPRVLPHITIAAAFKQVSRLSAVITGLLLVVCAGQIVTATNVLSVLNASFTVLAMVLFMLGAGYRRADQSLSVEDLNALLIHAENEVEAEQQERANTH